MQAARHAARALLGAGARRMSTPAQIAADASKGPAGNMVDTIGLWTITPLAVGVFVYDVFIHPEEEFEGQIPPYPYLRMRDAKKLFPWGSDLGLFEVHQHVPTRE